MAGAVGYALVQPPAVSLAIFLALAIGFAAPFTLISLFPSIARRLPRPGAWMDLLKRGLAFPMLGAFAWLVWVLTQQAGTTALAAMLASAVVLFIAAIGPLPGVIQTQPSQPDVQSVTHTEPVNWSPQTVAQLRGQGKAIFVNFTASWCITC